MTPTELAHWRYRVQALEPQVEKTAKLLDRWRDCFGGNDEVMTNLITGEIEALTGQLNFEQWLLEEAKFKSQLGEVELLQSQHTCVCSTVLLGGSPGSYTLDSVPVLR